MIVQIKDKERVLRNIMDTGKVFDLYTTGLTVLDEIYRPVRGYPLFIGGQVHHGKSEFSLELCVSLAKNHGFKFACYLGEAGNIEIAFMEIAQKIVGKPYVGEHKMSEADLIEAHQFIEKHFILLDIPDLTVKGFYESVLKAEKDLGIIFEGTLFDPFNDAKNETGVHGGTHIWLEEDLKFIRNQSQKNKRIDVVVFHVQEIKPIKDTDTNNWYVRPALPTEWAGGQVVNRRAFTQLFVYRPPVWMKNEHGQPYGENTTIVYNQKAKPKGTGKVGSCVIRWDWKANRYFEEVNGKIKYMLEKEQITYKQKEINYNPNQTFEPNHDFDYQSPTDPF